MVDIYSSPTPLTVQLPADLVAELQLLAREKKLSVDEIVREACLDYTEGYIWERCYKEHLREHPEERPCEFGIDGDDLRAPQESEKPS